MKKTPTTTSYATPLSSKIQLENTLYQLRSNAQSDPYHAPDYEEMDPLSAFSSTQDTIFNCMFCGAPLLSSELDQAIKHETEPQDREKSDKKELAKLNEELERENSKIIELEDQLKIMERKMTQEQNGEPKCPSDSIFKLYEVQEQIQEQKNLIQGALDIMREENSSAEGKPRGKRVHCRHERDMYKKIIGKNAVVLQSAKFLLKDLE